RCLVTYSLKTAKGHSWPCQEGVLEMKSYKTVTRIAAILLVLLLVLAGRQWTPLVAAQGASVEIEKVTHYAGNTDVYTNKRDKCIRIKRKSTGETWKGATDEHGRLVINTGVIVPKDDLEASEADDCPKPDVFADRARLDGIVTVAIETARGALKLR